MQVEFILLLNQTCLQRKNINKTHFTSSSIRTKSTSTIILLKIMFVKSFSSKLTLGLFYATTKMVSFRRTVTHATFTNTFAGKA